MNNLRNTLIGFLAFGLLLAPVAAADPLDSFHVEKDVTASYHADYTAVLDAKDAAGDIVADAKAMVQEKANQRAQATASASTGLGTGIVAGVKENLQAFLDWIKGLSVKPSPEASGYASATNAQDLVADARSLDGSIDGDAYGHLEATSLVEKNVTEPPAPKLGFLGEMRAAFDAFINW